MAPRDRVARRDGRQMDREHKQAAVVADAGAAPEGRVHESDPALVRACLAGDEASWEELVDRYGRLVYAIPRRLGLSEADAEDVFQNVFVALLRNLGRLRDQTRLSAWLITTARRESWRIGRASSRAESELDGAIVDDGPPPFDDVARWERDHTVRQALRRLDERCRVLLTSLYLEPAPARYDDIATRLGMPVGSIGPTRARCFKKMDAVLREMGIDGSV